MTLRSRLALAVVGLGLLLGPPAARAHDLPARAEQHRVGPYALEVALYTDPPRVDQAVPVTVRSLRTGPPLEGATVSVVGLPGPGTSANRTRTVSLQSESHEPNSYAGELTFVVRGAWDLEVTVDGPGGNGTLRLPVSVAAPPAIPVWLGWLVGLSPLVGLAFFAWSQRGYLRRLQAEHQPG